MQAENTIPISPRVSLGLPVFNGEQYLAETLESVLAQTYLDFELIISDNASTDQTEEICRDYQSRDDRIRYSRNAENLGSARNFNRTFDLARGAYFAWIGYDDPIAPTYVEKCVEVLERDREVVLCFARTLPIDAAGDPYRVGTLLARNYVFRPQLNSARPHVRFFHAVARAHPQGAIYGLIRRSVLQQTRLVGRHRMSDLSLLGELALLGRICQLPEYLQTRRYHPQQARHQYMSRRLRELWVDSSRTTVSSHPYWRLFREHLNVIKRAAPDWRTRACCNCHMLVWAINHVCIRAPLRALFRGPYRRLVSTQIAAANSSRLPLHRDAVS